jgi:hypothetical protein
VTATLQQRSRERKQPRELRIAVDEDRSALRFDSVDAARRHRAEALVDLVGRDRSQLEALRSRYLERLHRASDDFAATEDLRIVEHALVLVPGTHADSAWQDRVRRRSARVPTKRP